VFDFIKKMFKVEEAKQLVAPLPIEVNTPTSRLTNRKEARLQRLLTVKSPSKEIKEEILSLQKTLKG
jgi:hypothetical protein